MRTRRTPPLLDKAHWYGLALGTAFLMVHVSLYFAPVFLLIGLAAIPGKLRRLPSLPWFVAIWLAMVFVVEALISHFRAGADFAFALAATAGLASGLLDLLLGYRFPRAVSQ